MSTTLGSQIPQMLLRRVKPRYLSFEGGGGRGIVYLGAIKALEEKLKTRPVLGGGTLFPPQTGNPIFGLHRDFKLAQIKGITGASAGGINAFLLAMGMTYSEIEAALNQETTMETTKQLWGVEGDTKPISITESFFDGANTDDIISITEDDSAKGYIRKNKVEDKLNWSARTLIDWVVEPNASKYIEDMARHSTMYNKILGTSPEAQTQFSHLTSLLCHRGLFVGTKAIDFLADQMQKYLLDKAHEIEGYEHILTHPWNPRYVSFREFFGLTGVDLVIAGTNISQGKSRYFSMYHTPDFPVLMAVRISMNFPFIFKPIWVEYKVHEGRDYEYNSRYTGLWGDAGILNNLPIHAFDRASTKAKLRRADFYDKAGNRRIRKEIPEYYEFADNEPYTNRPLNPEMLAIRCGISKDEIPTFKDAYPESPKIVLGGFIGQLLETFMFPSEEGQIRSDVERKQTVELNTTYEIPNTKFPGISSENLKIALEVADFATPGMDRRRSVKKVDESSEQLARAKEGLIKQAYDTVRKALMLILVLFLSQTLTSCARVKTYPLEKRMIFEIDTGAFDSDRSLFIRITYAKDTIDKDRIFKYFTGDYSCADSISESYYWDSTGQISGYGLKEGYNIDTDTSKARYTYGGSEYEIYISNQKFWVAYRLLDHEPCPKHGKWTRIKCVLQRIEPGSPAHYIITDPDGSHEIRVPVFLTAQQVMDDLKARHLYPPPPNRKRARDYFEVHRRLPPHEKKD